LKFLKMFVLPFAVVFLLVLIALMATDPERFFPSRGEPVDVTFDELLDDPPRFARMKIKAHYDTTVRQDVPAGLMRDEATYYVFGAFPVASDAEKAIPLLVRTQRPPDRIVSFEVMTVEGRLGKIDLRKIPPSTEDVMGDKSPYWFSDDILLLEAWKVTSDGDVWEEAQD